MKDEFTRNYSERLDTLTGAQLQAALDRFGLGELLRAEPIPTGLFGQNVFLSTSTGEYVFRGGHAVDWQFPKERFFTKLIHERTSVPAPWPYLIDPTRDIFGWSYAIMPRMTGLQIGDPGVRQRLSATQKHSLAWAMGETLARLHELTWPHCGEYELRAGTICPISGSFSEWLISRMRARLERSRAASEATTDDDVAWVERVIDENRGALEAPFEPSFVHSDYKENNAVAEPDADGWRVTGVFDAGGGYFGDPEEDLARSVATYAREDEALAREFVGGYRAARTLRPGFAERFRIYMLADRLIIWEYGQRNAVWFNEGDTLREWAGRFVSLDLF